MSPGTTPGISTPTAAADGPPRAARGHRWLLAALPAAVFLVARVVDLGAAAVIIGRRTGRAPLAALHTLSLAGDGGWYARIAAGGYPRYIAIGPDGRARHSALAFFPVYPGIVAGIDRLLGAGFVPVAIGVSLLTGAVAATGTAAVVRPWAGAGTAALAGCLWALQPASPVTGLPYTEALFSAEVVVVLLLLAAHRYGWLLLLLPVTGLTRGTMPPLVVVLVAHLAAVGLGSGTGRRSGRALLRPALCVVVGALSALAWPAVVAVRTGRWDAYPVVQSGWNGRLELFAPWGRALRRIALAGGRHLAVLDVALLTVAVVAVLAVLAGWLRARRQPGTGGGPSVELVVLPVAFLAYLVALVPPDSSYPRFLLPVVSAPITVALLLTGRALRWHLVVVGACVAGQAAWLGAYVLGYAHLTP